jgi:hypothetical protein
MKKGFILAIFFLFLSILGFSQYSDLVVSNISVKNPNVNIGGLVSLTFSVKNIGSKISAPCHALITILKYQSIPSFSDTLSEVQIPQLLPNQETSTINFVHPIPYPTAYKKNITT